MPDARNVTSQTGWRVALAAVVAAVLFGFWDALLGLLNLWATKADYSHGFLVLIFSGYLLWSRRDLFPSELPSGLKALGLLPIMAAAGLYVVADKINIAKEWFQAFAILLAFVGIVFMFFGGLKGFYWAFPSLGFMVFTFQLPHKVEYLLSFRLQQVATKGSNFVFQLFGFPSYVEGNVIHIGETTLGVEKACAGLSMLLAFLTLTTAIVVLAKSRHYLDRTIVLFSAVPIALASNILRIFVTGLIYHAGWVKLGDIIVHDLAGWLMMPLALIFMRIEFFLIDWIVEPFVPVDAAEALGLPGRIPGGVR